MAIKERLGKGVPVILSGVEIQKSALLWKRIDELSSSCPFLADLETVNSSKFNKPVVFVNDVLYTVGVGVPVYRREILYFSKSAINPGILIEFRQTKSKQPADIYLTLNSSNSDWQNEEIEIPNKTSFPSWWPQSLRNFRVYDITNYKDLLVLKSDTTSPRQLIKKDESLVKRIEMPLDADFTYMWQREKSSIDKYLSQLVDYAKRE